jgi:hypothetical protein
MCQRSVGVASARRVVQRGSSCLDESLCESSSRAGRVGRHFFGRTHSQLLQVYACLALLIDLFLETLDEVAFDLVDGAAPLPRPTRLQHAQRRSAIVSVH